MRKYIGSPLTIEIDVSEIMTVHYFEFAKNYVFEGERHNFWEFVYVDKGEIEVMADTKGYKLKQGEIIFHKPNEFHNVWANGVVAPNIIIITFKCNSKAMKFFEQKIFNLGDTEKNLLAQIINEVRKTYKAEKSDEQHMLKKKEGALFASEQYIKLHLELFLINLVRKGTSIKSESRLSLATKERSENNMVEMIKNYMKENINKNLSFEDIYKFCGLSSTTLKVMFKEKTNYGVMEYFRNLKIEEAKKYIREDNLNFTEIAEKLGYNSIHYFSRHFKKATGMTPSEYASSVKIELI